MTTYFNDCSSLTGWTENDITTGSTQFAINGGAIESNTSLIETLSLNAVDSDAERQDCEILFKVAFGAISTTQYCGVVRGSDSDSTSTQAGYFVAIRTTALRVYYKNSGGSLTQISSVAATHSASTTYWVRLRLNGTAVKCKTWTGAIGDEPYGTWAIDTTDSSGPSGDGYAGFYCGGVSTTYTFSLFGVGTNGDTAPASAVGGGTTLDCTPISFEWAVSSASVSESLNASPTSWEWATLTGTVAENISGSPVIWQWETTTGTIEEAGFVTDTLNTTPIVWQWEQNQASFVSTIEAVAGTWSWETGTASVSESIEGNAGVFAWETGTATLLGTDEVVATIIPWEWETTTGNLLYVLPQQESGTIGGKPDKKVKLPFYDAEQEYESHVQVDEVQPEKSKPKKSARKTKVVPINDKAKRTESAKIAKAPLLGDLVQEVQISAVEVLEVEVEDEALIEDVVVSLLLAA